MIGGKEMWREHFQRGIEEYRRGNNAGALKSFSLAIDSAEPPPYTLFDSRAAAYEKAGRHKDALLDSKKVIDLAPDRWQGYARAGRLFFLLKKLRSAAQMTNLALQRIPDDEQNSARRESLIHLQSNISQAQATMSRPTANKSLVDPIGNLPVELVSLIFSFANDSPVTPVRLSHVSRRWRDIAISHPLLWRVLVLSKNKPVKKIKTWKLRARHWISELHLRNGPSQTFVVDGAPVDSWPLQTLILPELNDIHWDRIKVCKLDGIPPLAFESAMVACHLEGRLRSLEDFQVIMPIETMPSDIWPGPQTPSIFSPTMMDEVDDQPNAPREESKLRILQVDGIHCHLLKLAGQFHNLVSVDIRNSSMHRTALRAVMHANPNLEKFVFHAHRQARLFAGAPDITESLTLARLEHLELCFVSDVAAITKNLSLPALRVLRLWSIAEARSSFDSIVQNMGNTVGCLREISLRQSVVDSRTLVRVLLQSKHLKVFELRATTLTVRTNSIIDIFSDPPIETCRKYNSMDLLPSSADAFPVVCPSLTHVDLSQSFDLSAGPIVRMVSTRLKLLAIEPETGAEASRQSTEPSALVGCADGHGNVTSSSRPLQISRIESLVVDGCQQIEADTLPWLRQNVPSFSCVYMTKKDASRRR